MTPLELLQKRHSVRTFSEEKLDEAVVKKLQAEAVMINSHVAGLHFQLFFNNDDPFKGFLKSYGTFENARNYLVAIVDDSFEHNWEKAGYYGEKFAIKALELGIGTCFVGGTYDRSSVPSHLRAGEKILFLIVFGYPAEKIRFAEKMLVKIVHRKKMSAIDFFEPQNDLKQAETLFPELQFGLEGVACAPSSLNKRPVRVFLKELNGQQVPCAKVDESDQKNLIDLGIAKFNYNYATTSQCEWGNGSPLIGGEEDY